MCEKPSPRVLWSWGFTLLLPAVILTGIGVWLLRWLPHPFPTAIALLWIAILLLYSAYLLLRRKNMQFSIRDGYVCVTSGVLFRTRRMIALDAVRQITLLQGPVERLCRTAFVLVSATGGYLLIEGIDRQQAEVWCRRLTPDG